MESKFRNALKQYGTSEFSRWLLPDGQFLGVPDWEDHRIIGEFCRDSWLEFIEDGACSLHYDSSCGYLWIRTNGLTGQQSQAFRQTIEDFGLKIRELKVDFYDGQELEEVIEINDYMAVLYLTDSIAYNIEKSYQEER